MKNQLKCIFCNHPELLEKTDVFVCKKCGYKNKSKHFRMIDDKKEAEVGYDRPSELNK